MFARVEIEKPLLVSQVSGNLPEQFYLYQNYPNPFNPETNIRFSVNERTNISLVLYDVSGRKVKDLIENVIYSPGEYNFNFNSESLNSGVYFYSIVSDNGILSKKMIILK